MLPLLDPVAAKDAPRTALVAALRGTHDRGMTLRRIGRWSVLGLVAIILFFTVVWAGQIVLTERGLAELSLWTVVIDVAALIAAAAALVCLDRTFGA